MYLATCAGVYLDSERGERHDAVPIGVLPIEERVFMTATGSRRWILVAMAASLALGMGLAFPNEASAKVTGECVGSADFTADSVGPYTPDFDTRGNPIIVPKTDGNQANWDGSVPGTNTNFSGKVEIRIGPAWIEVADWGFPDHDGANLLDERTDRGVYNMDELWDVVPKNVVQGIYEARASHSADGVNCTADFFVKFEGSALGSPVVIVAIVLLVGFLALLVMAGRRGATGSFFSGRPVLAGIAAFFLALMIATLLQQFGVWPLDNLTVIALPLAMIAIGLVIAKFAPFGGLSPGVGEMARRHAQRAAAAKAEQADPATGSNDGTIDGDDKRRWDDDA